MSHDFYANTKVCKLETDGTRTPCNQCANWDSGLNRLRTQTATEGECCTGFMDYGNHPEYWSHCSVRNFEQHYVSENWAQCMPAGKL